MYQDSPSLRRLAITAPYTDKLTVLGKTTGWGWWVGGLGTCRAVHWHHQPCLAVLTVCTASPPVRVLDLMATASLLPSHDFHKVPFPPAQSCWKLTP